MDSRRHYYGEHRAGDTVPLGADVERPRTTMTAASPRSASWTARRRIVRGSPRRGARDQPSAGRGPDRRRAVHGLQLRLAGELRLSDGAGVVPGCGRWAHPRLGHARGHGDPAESCDSRRPSGAGASERSDVPTAGAVANALARFDGVRRYALPMKDTRGAGHAGSSGLGTGPGLGTQPGLDLWARDSFQSGRWNGRDQVLQDPDAWQAAMDVVENCYRVTKAFPSAERYGLTAQMRRAVVSVASNIAEG